MKVYCIKTKYDLNHKKNTDQIEWNEKRYKKARGSSHA